VTMKEDIREIKGDIKEMIRQNADMNRHLENLNGKVARHEKHNSETCPRTVENIECKINDIRKVIWKAMGAIAVLVFIISILLGPVVVKVIESYL